MRKLENNGEGREIFSYYLLIPINLPWGEGNRPPWEKEEALMRQNYVIRLALQAARPLKGAGTRGLTELLEAGAL